MQAVLDEAIEQYRRTQFLHELDVSFARLQANAAAWRGEEPERQIWDSSLGDGPDSE